MRWHSPQISPAPLTWRCWPSASTRYDDRPSEHYNPRDSPVARASRGRHARAPQRAAQPGIGPQSGGRRHQSGAGADARRRGGEGRADRDRLQPRRIHGPAASGKHRVAAAAGRAVRRRARPAGSPAPSAYGSQPRHRGVRRLAGRLCRAVDRRAHRRRMEQRLRVVRVFEPDCAAPPWLHDVVRVPAPRAGCRARRPVSARAGRHRPPRRRGRLPGRRSGARARARDRDLATCSSSARGATARTASSSSAA